MYCTLQRIPKPNRVILHCTVLYYTTGRGILLTLRILEVVTGRSKDLERAGKVQKIELFVNSEENVNGLLVSDGRGLLCTHLGGIVGGLEEGLI